MTKNTKQFFDTHSKPLLNILTIKNPNKIVNQIYISLFYTPKFTIPYNNTYSNPSLNSKNPNKSVNANPSLNSKNPNKSVNQIYSSFYYTHLSPKFIMLIC